jgi:hypothetical protein
VNLIDLPAQICLILASGWSPVPGPHWPTWKSAVEESISDLKKATTYQPKTKPVEAGGTLLRICRHAWAAWYASCVSSIKREKK